MNADRVEADEGGVSTATGVGQPSLGPAIMAFIICLLMLGMVVGSFDFTMEARTGPLLFGGVTFALSSVVLVRELRDFRAARRAARATAAHYSDGTPEDRNAPRAKSIEFWLPFIWLIVLVGSFILFGFLVGMAIFMVLFFKIYGRESWAITVMVSGGVVAFMYLLFFRILALRPFPGLMGDVISIPGL